MEMTIVEVLFMLSTAIALPVIAVLTFAFFLGGFKHAEDARFLPIREQERDWWSSSEPTVGGDGS